MLKINRKRSSLDSLDKPSLVEASISERYDLQEYIFNSPDAFFEEIGQKVFLIGQELQPSTTVADRIDLLAVDKEGTCIVIELKRGSNKLQMYQAISYAGMVAQWSPDEVFQNLEEDQQDLLEKFLDVDRDDVNRQQRIILVAEGFDYSLLAGAEWLSTNHNVDIICCRIAVAKDTATDSEYLTCSNIYPPPELTQEAVKRGRRGNRTTSSKWSDWDDALANIGNANIVSYFQQELSKNRECYLNKRILRYRLSGKRRWSVTAHNKNAYAWQNGRFDGDVEFWKARLDLREEVQPVKRNTCLRFFLNTEKDFRAFHEVACSDEDKFQWL